MSTTSTESLAADIVAGNGRTAAQVASQLPRLRSRLRTPEAEAKKPSTGRVSPSTIFRWIVRGVTLPDGRIVKLAAIRVAGRYLTTDAAVGEFFAAQNQGADASATNTARPARQRRTADADAARQLERLGI